MDVARSELNELMLFLKFELFGTGELSPSTSPLLEERALGLGAIVCE